MVKATDLGLLLATILIAVMVYVDSRITVLAKVSESKIQYNNIMDSAVDDAFIGTIEGVDSNGHAIINKKEVVENYLTSLYAGFGIMDAPDKQTKLQAYLPVMAYIAEDGYYISSLEEYTDALGDRSRSHVWKPKKYYVYQSGEYILRFTLTDYFVLYDQGNNQIYQGIYKDFEVSYPHLLRDELSSFETFDQCRRHTIIQLITNDLTYYINKHNEYAKKMGITYYFTFPEVKETTWYQSIEDVSFLAFIQGMPIKTGELYLNRYAFSSAKLLKSELYYDQRDSITNEPRYHRRNCTVLTDASHVYDTKESAALAGAYPCPHCIK